jgi:UPF0755 protein
MPERRRVFLAFVALAIAAGCICLLAFLLWPRDVQKNASRLGPIGQDANYRFEPAATPTAQALRLAKILGVLVPVDPKAFGGLASITAGKLPPSAADLAKRLARIGANHLKRDGLLGPNGALSADAAAKGLVELGAVVQVVNDQPAADESSDAHNSAIREPIRSYPLSAAALADQQSRAARYSRGDAARNGGANVMASASLTAPSPGSRPRAFDASEGTPLDPLLNTTYDLSYPKLVPR